MRMVRQQILTAFRMICTFSTICTPRKMSETPNNLGFISFSNLDTFPRNNTWLSFDVIKSLNMTKGIILWTPAHEYKAFGMRISMGNFIRFVRYNQYLLQLAIVYRYAVLWFCSSLYWLFDLHYVKLFIGVSFFTLTWWHSM